ncbi:MAG: glycoside hydrolase family 18 [Solirubrobacterales bacterium]|nr:glycoside hydrolase family 18 [Solirubrobacterales bacterium]
MSPTGARRAAVVLAACGATLGCTALSMAAGARAPTPARKLQAYVLSSAPDSLADLRAHARSVGVVYPTYFDCAVGKGALTGADVAPLTAYARSQQIVVMPRFNCQDGATVHLLLTDRVVRAATLSRLVAIARDRAYGGLNLDLENDGASDRQALTAFVATLAARLHALGKRLSVVVVGVASDNARASTGFYDDRALASLADSVFVLAWGAHWQRSAPGPIAPLATATATAAYVSSLPNASRFVLGAPMYGLDWPASGGPAHAATAYEYTSVVALAHAVHARVARDRASGELTFAYTDAAGVAHTVWYMDATSVAALLRVAHAHSLATGLWRLGEEDQNLWSSPHL